MLTARHRLRANDVVPGAHVIHVINLHSACYLFEARGRYGVSAGRCAVYRYNVLEVPGVAIDAWVEQLVPQTLKDSPQPQDPLAFGLWNLNSLTSGVTSKSMIVPTT